MPWDGAPQKRPTSKQPDLASTSQPESADDFPLVVKTSAAPETTLTQDQDLMSLSVQAFFAGVNWDGRSGGAPRADKAAIVSAGAAF